MISQKGIQKIIEKKAKIAFVGRERVIVGIEEAARIIHRAVEQTHVADGACAWCEQAADPNNKSVTACPFHDAPRR